MKKKLLVGLLGVVCALTAVGFASCGGGGHTTHTFDQEVVEEAYKKSDATCTTRATYYYSCECGEAGEETFYYGNTLAHTYDQEVVENRYKSTNATCTAKAKYYYSCECGARGTEKFETGDLLAHSYTRKVRSEEYLASEATCTTKSTYYYSCVCGEKGASTFEYGDFSHTYDQQVVEDAYKAINATCTVKAKYYYSCKCGKKGTEKFEGGETLAHTYNRSVVSDTYKAADATCVEKAKYYYTCSCGAVGTETFDNGDFTLHSYTGNTCGVCDYKVSLGLSYANKGTYYEVTGIGTCTDTELVIPDVHAGLPVKSIAKGAFEGCITLTSVEITRGITTISDDAFRLCRNLQTVIVPDSVTSMGVAFYGCNKLQSITLPFVGSEAGVTASTTFGYVFGTSSYTGGIATWQQNRVGSTRYYIPANLKSVTITGGDIPYGAFYNCNMLTSVTIGDSVTSIGTWAFRNCTSLTSVTIGDSVTSIGEGAFSGCSRLTSVTIGDSVESIGAYMISKCSNLTKVNYTGAIDGWVQIEFGNSIYSSWIDCGYDLYINDVLVTEANITTATKLSTYAFYNCESLTSVTIGDSVTSIDSYAFSGCTSLTKVNYTGTIDDWAQIDFVNSYANPVYFAKNLYINDILVTEANITTATKISKYAFRYCNSLTSVTIGDSVESIGWDAFSNCSKLTSIDIPDSVTSIGSSAFSGCTNLTSIEIPDSVTSIGRSAFNGCTSLTSVTIGDSVESIGEVAFYNCDSLTSVTIGDSVTSIGYEAFYGCSSLETMTIPFVGAGKTARSGCDQVFGYIFGYMTTSSSSSNSGTTYQYSSGTTYYHYYIPISLKSVTITGGNIPKFAFYNCTNLTSIDIPDSVTSIGEVAFYNCDSLTKVNYTGTIDDWAQISFGDAYANPTYYARKLYINDVLVTEANITTATKISDYAFSNCASLTSVVIGDSVTSIGGRAFAACDSLTSVTIGDGVTSIGASEFSGCTNLTSIDIPDSVTSIGSSAFSGCTNLTSIDIPDSVESIGSSAFYGCSSLETMTLPFVGASNTASEGYDQVFGYIFGYTMTYNSSVSGATYQYGSGSTYYHYYIPTSLKSVTITGGSIPYRAFYNCSMLTSIDIPDFVESIGSYAFYNCSSLTSIDIPDVVEGILYETFYNCKNLKSVTIGDSVTSIADRAFQECTSLTSVVIGDSVTSIGDYAFYGCSDLIGVNYTGTIDGWMQIEFGSWTNRRYVLYIDDELVTEVNITTATKISWLAFSYCDSLTSVVIDDGVEGIASGAFKYCTNLTNVTIGDGVESIASGAFECCTSLTEIVIPDSVTTIGYEAFYNCTNLKSVTMGGSVESIGVMAFCNCSSLTSIDIPDSVERIADSAFKGCSSLTNMTLPFVGVDRTPSGSSAVFGYIFGFMVDASSVGADDTVYQYCQIMHDTNSNKYYYYFYYYIPKSLRSVTITGEKIAATAFVNCSMLTSVVIGDNVTSIGGSAFSGCDNLSEVYYKGTVEEWDEIEIGTNNTKLTDATRYYYVENEADVPTDGGNYWHYVSGVPTKWVID